MEVSEREYVTSGRGQSGGPANAIRTDDTFMRRVQDSLSAMRDILVDARSELSMMSDRNLGAPPPNPTGAADQAKPYGRFAEIDAQLADLHFVANEVASLARSANSRI